MQRTDGILYCINLLYPALENNGAQGQVLLIEQQNACFLAHVHSACPVRYAYGLCGVKGGGPYGVRKGDAKLYGLAQAAHKAGNGTGKGFGMAGYGGPSVPQF